MKRKSHLKTVSRTPEKAQISNFQIKMESTTEIIDRLLLANRQAPWKATGPSGTTTDTDTGTDTGTDTTGVEL